MKNVSAVGIMKQSESIEELEREVKEGKRYMSRNAVIDFHDNLFYDFKNDYICSERDGIFGNSSTIKKLWKVKPITAEEIAEKRKYKENHVENDWIRF